MVTQLEWVILLPSPIVLIGFDFFYIHISFNRKKIENEKMS